MIDKELALKFCYPSPQQHPPELEFMIDLLNEIKPKKILEIGTGCGAFTTILAMSGAKVVTVDNRGNDPQYWGFPKIYENLPKLDITFHLLDSQNEATRELIKDDYDLVVIDADHTLKGGTKDYELYANLGKVVAIHDIAFYFEDYAHREDFDWFPTRFWHKVKTENKLKTREFVDISSGGWGVIFNQ